MQDAPERQIEDASGAHIEPERYGCNECSAELFMIQRAGDVFQVACPVCLTVVMTIR